MDKHRGEIYMLVERAIDEAMTNERFLFKCYEYLKLGKWTRHETNEFIESSTASNLGYLISELDEYLEGKDKVIKESYGYLGKPRARKIRHYLHSILEDALKYHAERKPGRRKSLTK